MLAGSVHATFSGSPDGLAGEIASAIRASWLEPSSPAAAAVALGAGWSSCGAGPAAPRVAAAGVPWQALIKAIAEVSGIANKQTESARNVIAIARSICRAER